jgi:hypothetical protein
MNEPGSGQSTLTMVGAVSGRQYSAEALHRQRPICVAFSTDAAKLETKFVHR